MGPTWSRYGDPGDDLGEDWPRALAHELSHYLFFLDDNYLGFSQDGVLVPVDGCSGAMSDPYREDDAAGYDEYHLESGWLPDCTATLSNQLTGRADWSTIATFYPWLNGDLVNYGPSRQPLALTEIVAVSPITPTTTLHAPIFNLTLDGHSQQVGGSARAFLLRDDHLVDLGRPTVDQVLTRGAQALWRFAPTDGGKIFPTPNEAAAKSSRAAMKNWPSPHIPAGYQTSS